MRQNAARRTQLLDAAIEILAREGARGLTYRALDVEADLPTGTASNYFRNRHELLRQAGEHVHVLLQPNPVWLAARLEQTTGPALLTALLQNLVERVLQNRSAYLALLELRLEATRHPDLRATLFDTIQNQLRLNGAFGPAHGLPLGAEDFTLLYLAISGLLIEELTLPGVLDGQKLEALVQAWVARLMPEN